MVTSLRRAGSWLRRAAAWMGLDERVCERIVRRPRRAYCAPALERLEDRLAPAVWTGLAGNGLWSSAGNWVNNAVPTSGDNFIIFETNLTTTSGGSTLNTSSTAYNTIDDIPNLVIEGVIFDNGTAETVHTAGSQDPFALGGAAQAGTTGYTISGTNTLNIETQGDNGSGIDVVNGVSNGTPSSLQETFGTGITINQDSATSFYTADTGTQLVFNGAVTLNNFTLTADGAFTESNNIAPGGQGVALNGVISGSDGLDLIGVVGLNGPNTYTGTTTLGNTSSGAILEVGNNSGLGNAANTTVLTNGSGSGLNLDGVSVTQANLMFNSGNTLYSAFSSSTWNGQITLEGGTETLATIGSGSRLAINGVIGGAGALSVGGLDVPGVVELQQNNTYTGVTTVGDILGGSVAGTLQIDAPAGLGAGGAGNGTTVTSGSTLALDYTSGARLQDGSGNAEQLTLDGTGISGLGALTALVGASAAIPGAVTLAGATTIVVHTGVLTFDAPIGQSTPSSLTILGSGTVVFAASNTYSGTTTLTNGTLQVNAIEPGAFTAAPLAGFAAVLNGSGSVGAVTLNTSASGNLGATLAPGDGSTPGILHTGNVTLDAGSTFNSLLNGPAVGSQYSQLDSTGTVTLNSAKLTIDVGAALAANTTFTLIQAASVVGTFGNAPTSGSNITLGGYTFKITYTSTTVVLTFLGVVDFWTGAAGDGLWSDAGNWAGGAAPVNGATVVFETNLTTTAGGSTLNTGADAYNTVDDIPNVLLDGIVFDDGTAYSVHTAGSDDPFALGGAAQANPSIYSIGGTNTITLSAGAAVTVENGVTSSGNTVEEVFGSGVTLQTTASSSANIVNGGATFVIFDGPVVLSGTNVILNVLGEGVNNSYLPGQVQFNGVISGTGSLNLGGTVTLAAANTYAGTTTIGASTSGNVFVTNNNGLGAPGNTVTTQANSGSGLQLEGVSITQANFSLGADTVVYAYAGSGGGGPDDTWNGPITLNNGTFASIQTVGTGVRLAINGAIGGNAGGFEVGGAEGSGVVEFEQANTFTGAISVGASFPETLQIDNPAGLGAGGAGNGTTVTSGSTLALDYTSGAPLQDGSGNAEQLTLDGVGISGLGALTALVGASAAIPGAVTLAGATTIGVHTGVLTFDAPIGQSTPSSLTIAAGGTVVFDAANTYSGTTTLINGTLQVNANEPGAFTVAPLAGFATTLDGSGSVGAVTYNTSASGNLGATLAPGVGSTIGTLTATSVTLDSGSTFVPLLNGPGVNSELFCNGPLNINGATLSIPMSYVFPIGQTFTVVQDSLFGNTFFSNAPFDGATLNDNGIQFRINYDNDLVTATVLTNPTSEKSTVDVAQVNQQVSLALVVQFAPGTTAAPGVVTVLDALGHQLTTTALTVNPATGEGTGTALFLALSAGPQTVTLSYAGAVTGPIFGGFGRGGSGGGGGSPMVTLGFSPSDGPLPLPSPGVDISYDQPIEIINGNGPYQFGLGSGAGPLQADNLNVDPNTGAIVGTPLGVGTFTFTISAQDSTPVADGGPYTGQVTYTLVVQPNIMVTANDPNGLDPATQYMPYNANLSDPNTQKITAFGDSSSSFTFTVSGLNGVVAGLSWVQVDGADIVISGTPTVASPPGGFPITITATDPSLTGAYSTPQTFNLKINAASITVGQATLPPLQVGVPYNGGEGFQLTASGGNGDYTFSPSQLPNGMNLSASGVLSGMPTAAGPYSFTVTAHDSAGSNTTPTPFSGTVLAPILFLTPPGNASTPTQPVALPVATVNQLYSETISASGGAASQGFGSYSYALAAVPGVSLPTWLSVNPTTGALSGTPPNPPGQVEFEVTATDSSTNQQGARFTVSQYYSLNINSAGVSLLPSDTTLPAAVVNTLYTSPTFSLQGGENPVTFSWFSGSSHPSWLSLNQTTGVLTGTPPDTGTFTFTIEGTDSSQPSKSASGTYTLTVDPPIIAITPAAGALPTAVLNAAYSPITFSASGAGGTEPYTFSVVGSLPSGLSLSPGGVLSGKPLAVGSYSFGVKATDSSGGTGPYSNTQNYTYTLVVRKFAGAPPAVLEGDGSLLLYGAQGVLSSISGPGSIQAVSAVADATGNEAPLCHPQAPRRRRDARGIQRRQLGLALDRLVPADQRRNQRPGPDGGLCRRGGRHVVGARPGERDGAGPGLDGDVHRLVPVDQPAAHAGGRPDVRRRGERDVVGAGPRQRHGAGPGLDGAVHRVIPVDRRERQRRRPAGDLRPGGERLAVGAEPGDRDRDGPELDDAVGRGRGAVYFPWYERRGAGQGVRGGVGPHPVAARRRGLDGAVERAGVPAGERIHHGGERRGVRGAVGRLAVVVQLVDRGQLGGIDDLRRRGGHGVLAAGVRGAGRAGTRPGNKGAAGSCDPAAPVALRGRSAAEVVVQLELELPVEGPVGAVGHRDGEGGRQRGAPAELERRSGGQVHDLRAVVRGADHRADVRHGHSRGVEFYEVFVAGQLDVVGLVQRAGVMDLEAGRHARQPAAAVRAVEPPADVPVQVQQRLFVDAVADRERGDHARGQGPGERVAGRNGAAEVVLAVGDLAAAERHLDGREALGEEAVVGGVQGGHERRNAPRLVGDVNNSLALDGEVRACADAGEVDDAQVGVLPRGDGEARAARDVPAGAAVLVEQALEDEGQVAELRVVVAERVLRRGGGGKGGIARDVRRARRRPGGAGADGVVGRQAGGERHAQLDRRHVVEEGLLDAECVEVGVVGLDLRRLVQRGRETGTAADEHTAGRAEAGDRLRVVVVVVAEVDAVLGQRAVVLIDVGVHDARAADAGEIRVAVDAREAVAHRPAGVEEVAEDIRGADGGRGLAAGALVLRLQVLRVRVFRRGVRRVRWVLRVGRVLRILRCRQGGVGRRAVRDRVRGRLAAEVR